MTDFDKTLDFIKGLYPNKNIINLHEPIFKGNEERYVVDAIKSTYISSFGKYVDKFEKSIETITGTKSAVAIVNGTSALQIALKLAGVNSDDEVITQSLTFVATVNSIMYLDAKPVFIDVDKDTMGMSPESLKDFLDKNCHIINNQAYNKITGKKISACLPMHTFGFICRIDEIVDICNDWMIPVVEDAAEALGSCYKGKSAGSFGKISTFSFNGNKIVTSGGGGAIVTNDVNLGKRAKHLTTTAKKPHKWEYIHDEVGYNFRMPNLNAAIVNGQIENLDKMIICKKKLYNEYLSFFNKTNINLVPIPKNVNWNFWLISIILKDKNERDSFLNFTNENSINTRPIWRLMHKLPMFNKFQKNNLYNSEFLYERVVNIPSSARL